VTRLLATALSVRRGRRLILDDISLNLVSGQLVAVLGPNGAGKSTLLACLAGLQRPDAGTVTLDGVALSAIGARALARRRAYLPQGAQAEWPIAVERLVALGLSPHLPAFGGLPAAWRARIDRALDAVDLADRRDQPATTLSGGELARAMLARALVGEPELLLVDEPLAELDPRHAIDGMARLRALAEHGTLVIVATHDLSLAARYAHVVLLLRDGRLVVAGPAAATLSAAAVERVFDVAAEVHDAGTPRARVALHARR